MEDVMPRTLWKGAISFGLVNIPVGLYSAENRNSFDLDLLDKRTITPVGFKRYNKETGKDVSWNDIVKGYEYEKGKYVVLTDEDFRRANVEATQTVEIVKFVDGSEIAPVYFETPYYLVPQKRGEKGYALLREILMHNRKVAIATVVIRTRQYVTALIPVGDVLVMNTLRYANEIRSADNLDVPSRSLKSLRITEKEIEMGNRLVQGMTGKWNPKEFHDTYHEDLLALIQKRIKAGKTEAIDESEPKAKKRPEGRVIDLMGLLKKSVERKTHGQSRKKSHHATHHGKRKAA
jgi:DNA end-binding protein Ku